jgi:hypothetical protein
MSTKNYDSSLLTQRKQSKALAAFATAVQNEIETPTGQFTVRRTQPTNQRSIYVTEQNLGKCYCANDKKDEPYGFNPSGGQCGCGLGAS